MNCSLAKPCRSTAPVTMAASVHKSDSQVETPAARRSVSASEPTVRPRDRTSPSSSVSSAEAQVSLWAFQASGPFPSASASLSPFGCRPSRIVSTNQKAAAVGRRLDPEVLPPERFQLVLAELRQSRDLLEDGRCHAASLRSWASVSPTLPSTGSPVQTLSSGSDHWPFLHDGAHADAECRGRVAAPPRRGARLGSGGWI
jgi:hypothetical protein